ncbi:MAG: DNA polymerase III subunit gamma/tau [Clostridia bacterium]
MGYTALYRKFRPLNFSEMVGQEHIVRTLKNQIMANRVGHAYLFNGSRGTGKTSAAKILARAINCLNPKDGEPCNECEICKGALSGSLTDIVEMDAASNNSVEDIRSIREEVNFLPTKAKYRVYIIDEVHMLSTGAFNALLKTLEEPPEHVKFILATTEPQKLPATILSRCQRFDFKKIPNEDIIKRLELICKESDIDITEEALNIIAVLSEGAMRDALSILERCIQDGKNKIDEDKIKDLVGIPKMVFVHDIVDAVINCNVDNALITINKVLDDGKDLSNLLLEMIKYVKDILLYKVTNKLELYSQDEINKIKEISDKTDKEKLINLVYQFSELGNDIKFSTQKNIIFQAGIIKMCSKLNVNKNDDINTRVEKIEKYLKNHTVNTNQYKTMPITQEKNTIPNINLAKSVEQKNTNVQSSEIVTNIPKNNSSKISAASSNKAEEYWPQVVKKLKQNGKIVLYTNLMNTRAKEINDMTVGIEFLGGLTSFGKTILEKQENIKELTNLVSMASGKPMNIKYITNEGNINNREVNDIGNIARESDIPFNVID